MGFLYACVSTSLYISVVSSGLFFLGGGEAFYSFVSREREGRSLYYTSLLEKFMSEGYAVMQSCANVDELYFSLYSIFY